MIWQPGETLDSMEKRVILEAFQFYRGNKTQTAGSLKIAIKTLTSKLEKYEADGVEEERRRDLERAERKIQLEKFRGTPGIHRTYSQIVTGVRLEPVTDSTAESKVSLSERPQVQEVLSKHATGSHKGKGR